jgi:large subunit ribosomal protein L29
MMKADEVHKLSAEELVVEEQRLRRKIYDLRAQAVTEKIENPKQGTAMRRDIARLLTEKKLRQSQAKA